MTKGLVIVFVKNIKLGTVKTRLAKTIGNQGAFEVYKELVDITEKATSEVEADKRIYFSDAILDTKWVGFEKFVQQGEDLGTRMKNAFGQGFADGYERIVLIGSDLPDINASHIYNGLKALEHSETVFGPAIDGGYYLIGLSKIHDCVFENKPWSQSILLQETLSELKSKNITFSILETLNDIDTFEDLIASDFYKSNAELQEKIKQLND
ncbi:TIGR04282 family arsenosugar biosynthesis glycosyltransferase [Hyunsoonleella sp. SJ7]|uniref:TIGR04282 family arsenosugar biosynthesis glycosyltransferase n=1 Tax=Hyunsoonleella aquatilis TaxID=2762758 RepID=A0A923H900_9FLAO|nr:TIGR04282 family arsenosugar biosynthesis glycosyltransferase [Hyunsoonleella aquatilis]MBC3757122.1 TIGR04282 family arsenosugar biosynthesis glycosyltransferase [Hyunsoonleella aquatilis]